MLLHMLANCALDKIGEKKWSSQDPTATTQVSVTKVIVTSTRHSEVVYSLQAKA
jgi:hypothetical protein